MNWDLIFAENAPSSEIYDWEEDKYKRGWGYLGYTQPPPMELFNKMQWINDTKSKYLYDQLIRTNNLLAQRVVELENKMAEMQQNIEELIAEKEQKGIKSPNSLTVSWRYVDENGDMAIATVEYDGSVKKYIDLSEIYGTGGNGQFVQGAGIFDIIDDESVDAIVSSKGENTGNEGSNGKLDVILNSEINTIVASKGEQIGGNAGSGDIQLELTTEEEINDIVR